ncbi:MAG: hypothetical protein EOO28_29645 [Comamonadaceae bacterium]|nr:MAG: hypothetical protein EOO28_29645 [Comamonadaceae bacterium]
MTANTTMKMKMKMSKENLIPRIFPGRPKCRSQSGLSLVEASFALVICGVMGIVLWQFVVLQAQQSHNLRSQSMISRAKVALGAYAALHAQLPCPAPDTRGVADCGGAADGYLPYLTLGLPDPDAGRLQYAPTASMPSLTGTSTFAFRALMSVTPATPEVEPVAVQVPLRSLSPHYDGMLDFCAALVAPGMAETAAYTVFEKPDGLAAKVLSTPRPVTRLQLFGMLHCPALVTTAGRAHFNTQLAAATMSRSIQDYRTQFEVAFGLAQFDVSQGIWFMVNGVYGAWRKWAKVHQASSAVAAATLLPTLPVLEWKLFDTVQASVASTVYAAAMVSNVARFLTNREHARQDRETNNVLAANAIRLEEEITRNAILNSSSVFFLAEQNLPPVGSIPPKAGPPYQMTGPAAEMVALADAYMAQTGGAGSAAPAGQGSGSGGNNAAANTLAAQLAEELRTCGNPVDCDALTARFTAELRQKMDAQYAAQPTLETSLPNGASVSSPNAIDRSSVTDAPIGKLYDALANCPGDADCTQARQALANGISQKSTEGSTASSGPGQARPAPSVESIAEDLRLCAQDQSCNSAANREKISRFVKGGSP